MKHLRLSVRLFLIGFAAVFLASCAALNSVIGGDGPAVYLTSPEAGTVVTITNQPQTITISGTVEGANGVDIDSVTVNPNGNGPRPATCFAGRWSVDITVSANNYTIEVIAKDVNGNETKQTYSFTVVYDPNYVASSSSSSSSDSSSSDSSSSSSDSSSSSSSDSSSSSSDSSSSPSGAQILGLLQVSNASALNGYSVDVTLDTDDDPANGGYTNIGFTFDSADPSYYFDGLPIDGYYVRAVIHKVSSAGELPVVGDFVGKLPMVVNVTDAGIYDYQDIQMKPMPAPFVLTVSSTEIQSGGSYVVSTNSFMIVDVQVSPTNAPLPVEISYFFTNISAGWTGASLSNSTDLSYSSFEIPVSHLQQLYSTAYNHSSYVEVRAMDIDNNMAFDGFTLTVDAEGPVISTTDFYNGLKTVTNYTFSINSFYDDLTNVNGGVSVYLNGSFATNITVTPADIYLYLSNGSNEVVVQAQDEFGNYRAMSNYIIGTN